MELDTISEDFGFSDGSDTGEPPVSNNNTETPIVPDVPAEGTPSEDTPVTEPGPVDVLPDTADGKTLGTAETESGNQEGLTDDTVEPGNTQQPELQYTTDDIYTLLEDISQNQTTLIEIGKKQNSIFLAQLFVLCLISGFLLARIVWRKI